MQKGRTSIQCRNLQERLADLVSAAEAVVDVDGCSRHVEHDVALEEALGALGLEPAAEQPSPQATHIQLAVPALFLVVANLVAKVEEQRCIVWLRN